VRQAQESARAPRTWPTAPRFWLTWIALGGGRAHALAAWLIAGAAFDFALERMVTVMVITCPHALGLAVPLVVAVSTAISASPTACSIRDRAPSSGAGNLQAVIFDKTGTSPRGASA
jgi:P-type Cu2+ transporter